MLPDHYACLNIYLEDSCKDYNAMLGRLNYFYRHGLEDSAITEEEKFFLEVVNYAHEQLLDIKNQGSKAIIVNKIKDLYKIKTSAHVHYIIDVANALHNTAKVADKKYQREMMCNHLLRMIIIAENDKDHRAIAKYWELYANAKQLNTPDADGDNDFADKIFNFTNNPETLKDYNAEDAKAIRESVKVLLEIPAKTKIHG